MGRRSTRESAVASVAARRRLWLEMALRRARPGTGSADLLLWERTAVATWPDLTGILAGLPWAVVGAVATRAYMPERSTQDLDILVAAEGAQEVRARLEKAQFQKVREVTTGKVTWRSPSGPLVDVVELRAEWVPEALEHLGRDPQGLPVLALPYMVLMKVESGRAQDLADAARMLGLASEEHRQETRRVFQHHAADTLEDLESLITLGKLEMGEARER